MGLAASLLVLTAAGGLTFTYWLQQRQQQAAQFAQVLAETKALRDKARRDVDDPASWREALAALERAEGQGADDQVDALRNEIRAGLEEAERDARLRQALVEVRANQEDVGADGTDDAYPTAFHAADMDLDALEPAELARRLSRRREAVAIELSAFLDDWSAVRRTAGRSVAVWRKPLEAARLADPDPYRDQLRKALMAEDRRREAGALKVLSAAPEAADLPAPTAVLLGRALADSGEAEAAVALLRPAAVRHPGDVWVNSNLAWALERQGSTDLEEAVRYFTAARALRPETAHELAHLLERMGRGTEAEAVFRDLTDRRPENARHLTCLAVHAKNDGRAAEAATIFERAVAAAREAIRLHRDDFTAHNTIGLGLHEVKQDYSGAEAELRAAIRLRPDDATAHHNLGNALSRQGKVSEAIAAYREAIRLRPDGANAHNSLGMILWDLKHDYAGAEAEFREAIRLQPHGADAHNGLGRILSDLKHDYAGAEAEFREAIRLQPHKAMSHANLGNALSGQGKWSEAIAAFREAIRLKPDLAGAYWNLSGVLRTSGDLPGAVAASREALRLQPDAAEAHCNLGAALRKLGQYAESLAEFRLGHELGSKRAGWRYPSAAWVAEAERMAALAARLPALLKGDDRPKDIAERLALAQICYDTKRHASAARFWAEALQAEPKLGDDRQAGHRYNAACAAALAGSGQGTDDPKPDAAARTRLRGQALDWLKAELAAWAKVLNAGDVQARSVVRQKLQHWQADSDLDGVRDREPIEKLPEGERRAWEALWRGVDALLKGEATPEPTASKAGGAEPVRQGGAGLLNTADLRSGDFSRRMLRKASPL